MDIDNDNPNDYSLNDEVMRDLELSQGGVARVFGVDPHTVGRWRKVGEVPGYVEAYMELYCELEGLRDKLRELL